MCGLVGIITKNSWGFSQSNNNLFTQALYCDALRGFDSTGIYLVENNGNVTWCKEKGSPIHLIGQKVYQDILSTSFKSGKFLIGHNRKATSGEVSDKTAHPFVKENKILVHNGYIQNHKQHAATDVDSECLVHLLNEKSIEEMASTIQGAFSLIWYDADKKELYLLRNDRRPLHILETKDVFILCSEVKLFEWLLDRETTTIIDRVEVKPGELYTFGIDNNPKKEFTVRKIPLYTPPVIENKYSKWEPPKSGNMWEGFAYGQEICFDFENYEDPPIGLAHLYDGIVYGNLVDDPTVTISCYFKDSQWELMQYTQRLFGRIRNIRKTNEILNLELEPNSLSTSPSEDCIKSWALTSSNSHVITKKMWEELPHKCQRCSVELNSYDIPDTFIKYKSNGNHKVICGECIAIQELHVKEKETK